MKQIYNVKTLFTKSLKLLVLFLFMMPVCLQADTGSLEVTAIGGDDTNPTATVVISDITDGEPAEYITISTENLDIDCPAEYSYNLYVDGVLVLEDFCNLTDFDLATVVPDVTAVVIVSASGQDTDGEGDFVVVTLTVDATWGEGTESEIIDFSIDLENGPAIIDPIANTVDLEATFGTDISVLIPDFELSYDATATVSGVTQLSGVSVNDYTSSVVYTVTSGDGLSTEDWTINITAALAPLDLNDMLTFEINGNSAVIDGSNITLELPLFTDITSMIPEFTSDVFSTVDVGGAAQESGVTEHDFSTPIIYTVTAQDGTSTQDYTVTVSLVDLCGSDFIIDTGATFDETSETYVMIPPAGQIITLDFTVWNIDIGAWSDNITIYDGPNTSSPVIGSYGSGIVSPGPITSTAVDGSLTVLMDVTFPANNYTLIEGNITCNIASSENDMLSFSLENQTGDAIIDDENYTIDIEVGIGTGLLGLIPDFTISEFAQIDIAGVDQVSGVTENDYDVPIVYTVTAQDGSIQEWTITVTESLTLSDSKDITSFSIDDIDAVIGTNTIDITLSVFDPGLEDLVATFISSPFSTVAIAGVDQTSGVTENDYDVPVIYTVTAQNGTTKDYTVTLSIGDVCASNFSIESALTSDETDETYIMIPPAGQAVSLDFTSWNVDVGLYDDEIRIYNGSDASAALIGVYGNGSVNPGPIVSTAPNGALTLEYIVGSFAADNDTQVTSDISCVAGSSENDMLSFYLENQASDAVLDADNHTIDIVIGLGTGMLDLIPEFTISDGAEITISGVAQESGLTENDYDVPVVYTVTAQDGTTQDWTVTLTEALTLSDANDMISFELDGVAAVFGAGTIDITLETFLGSAASLVIDFTSSPLSTVEVGGVIQESGLTANDFTDPVVYTVIAQDGSTQEYIVTVTVGDVCGEVLSISSTGVDDEVFVITPTAGNVISLDFTTWDIDISEWDIVVTIYNGQEIDPDQIIGQYDIGSLNPGTIASTSLDGALTFVYAGSEFGGFVDIEADIICVPASSENDITSFSFAEQTGPAVIDFTANTVNIGVSFFADITNLIPDFTLSELALAEVGGEDQFSGITANDYTAPLSYTVIAQDGTTQDWLITVTPATSASDENDITSFSVNGMDAVIGTTTIDLILEYTDISSLVPEFTSSLFSTVSIGGISQTSGVTENDFTTTIIYTVTAEDGTTKDYTVNISSPSTCSTSISLPESPGLYEQNEDISWTILPDLSGDLVTLSFNSFSTEVCCDFLYVYEGVDDTGVLLATLSGTTIPDNISSSNGLYLHFTSDESVTSDGFEFDIFCGIISDDTSLIDLSVDGTTVAGFAPETYTYTVLLPSGTTVIPTVTATTTDDGATVSISDPLGLPGVTIITVTAEDGSTQDYTISFEVLTDPEEAKLFSITIDGEELSDFNAETYEYTIYVPVGTTEVPEISGVTINPEATVVLTNAAGIPGTSTLEVTSEDGTIVITYIVHFAYTIGVDEFSESTISLYPNPASDVFIIEGNFPCEEVTLVSTEGKVLRKITINEKQTIVNVSELADGIYFLKSCQSVQKILIRH